MTKYKTAETCNMNFQRETYNFYGVQHPLFTKHLNVFLRITIASKCFRSYCPKKELEEDFKSYPSFDCKSQHDLIENIKQQSEEGQTSNCRKPIQDGVVNENDIH